MLTICINVFIFVKSLFDSFGLCDNINDSKMDFSAQETDKQEGRNMSVIYRKKLLSRFLTLSVSLMMALAGVLAFASVPAEAKAAPKLSAKSVTIAKGGKQTIRLKSGKGSWTIKSNGVARIKSRTKTSVTIIPVKAGNTVVTCKAGGKKLSCKVRVLNNRIGEPKEELGYACVVGRSVSDRWVLREGVKVAGVTYDEDKGKVTLKTTPDEETGRTTVDATVKALKPGRFSLKIEYDYNGEKAEQNITFAFINGFRGKAKAKKNEADYNKWRKKTIAAFVSADMSTWEIIDAIGTLISTGKYGLKGGATSMQLWYGGNGTCVSGAKMMDDFMKDIGVSSKIHFMGNKGGAVDIFGYNLMYASQHRNTWVTLGGKMYELNPQPGFLWPAGVVKR